MAIVDSKDGKERNQFFLGATQVCAIMYGILIQIRYFIVNELYLCFICQNVAMEELHIEETWLHILDN